MKRNPLYLLVCLLIALPLHAKLYTATQDIKVKKGAGNKYVTIATVKKGENIEVTDIKGGWGKLTYDEKEGYIPVRFITDVVTDDTPPPAPEAPDTDDGINTQTLIGLGVIVLILLGLQQYHNFRNKRKSAGAPADEDKPKHKPVYWFYCISCKQKINAEKQPTNHYCPKADDHTWINLGEAGNINYYCKECGIQVRTKKEPSARNCPGGSTHTWNDLGAFGDKNYYCKNCGISVLVNKQPPTVNCGNGEAHAWREL